MVLRHHPSYAGRCVSDRASDQASQSVDAVSCTVQLILERSVFRNPSTIPQITETLEWLGIAHTSPYRRVISESRMQFFEGQHDRCLDQVHAMKCAGIYGYSVTLPIEDWRVLEQTFAWLGALELNATWGIAPRQHHQLAADVCVQDGEQRCVDPDSWSWWLHRYGHGHTAWLFDDPNSTDSRLVPNRVDQNRWKEAVGRIVLKLGGDWNCERIKSEAFD